MWNAGIVASYRTKDADPKYGTYEVPEYELQDNEVTVSKCEDCEYEEPINDSSNTTNEPSISGSSIEPNVESETGDIGEEQQSEGIDSIEQPNQSIAPCPMCSGVMSPETKTEQVPVQTGTKVLPKTRVLIEVKGPLFWKTNYYATKQSDCTYFIDWTDLSKSTVKSIYCSDFEDSDLSRAIDAEYMESLDRFSRAGHAYPSDPVVDQSGLVTVTKVWLRPSEYWKCKSEDTRKKLAKDFPVGAYITFIGKNDTFAEASAKPEDMFDVRIEIGQAGLSTYLSSDPISRPLMPVQEITNQLTNVSVDTVDHAMADSFADPEVLNFDAYGKNEAKPGTKYPVKPKGGKPLSESFYEGSKATLSGEVVELGQEIQRFGQFVVGDFPSLYGGSGSNTSRTKAEYEQSRVQALQRLQITWTFIVDWWVRTIEGAVRTYASIVAEDERFAKWDNGNYINVWIRIAELSGKVGGVESEASDQFPVSLQQKKGLIMQLMEMRIPQIDAALYTPDNARILQDALAANEFKIPGEGQRLKQVIELNELTKQGSQPTVVPNPANPLQPINQPSVPIDPDVDDDAVHIAVCKTWAVDLPGMDCKKLNPAGYMNVIAHMKAHEQNLMLKTLQSVANAPVPGQQPATSEPAVE
jgi:hypothetical protein